MKKRLLLTAFVLSPLAVLAILMWLLSRGLWEQATRPLDATPPGSTPAQSRPAGPTPEAR